MISQKMDWRLARIIDILTTITVIKSMKKRSNSQIEADKRSFLLLIICRRSLTFVV